MINKGNSDAGAVFSGDGKYRYRFWRSWDVNLELRRCMFLMLNPSTATHEAMDPTVTRCQNYAKAWGYGGFEVCNIFAYRATDPKDMKAQRDPIGEFNDKIIVEVAKAVDDEAGHVVCAWGSHGCYRSRSAEVRRLMLAANIPLHFLTLTNRGEPGHPLYLKGDLLPQPWEYWV